MKTTHQIAKNLRDTHCGGNWTGVNLKGLLEGVSWLDATKCVFGCHSIATLLFHTNYYIKATIVVLEGGPLEAKDEFSFDCDAIESEAHWEKLKAEVFGDAEKLACLIEELPVERLNDQFVEERNGNYFRCLVGPVEHCQYHFGQIALIKRILASGEMDG